jgi:signal transduction histidine kinase
MAHEALAEVRGLMDALEVPVSDIHGLAAEFRRFGELILHPHGLRLDVAVESVAAPPSPCGYLFPGLLRIVKEALANVVKHSQASAVELRLIVSSDALSLSIHDDGRGIDPQQRNGRGLLSMHQRAAELGGTMTLDSGPGLRLRFDVPWRAPVSSTS